MFHLYNLPRKTKWQSTFNKQMVHGSDKTNTDFPYGMQNVQVISKITLTFKQSNGGAIHTFHLYM